MTVTSIIIMRQGSSRRSRPTAGSPSQRAPPPPPQASRALIARGASVTRRPVDRSAMRPPRIMGGPAPALRARPHRSRGGASQAMEAGVRVAKETAYEEHSVFAPEVLRGGGDRDDPSRRSQPQSSFILRLRNRQRPSVHSECYTYTVCTKPYVYVRHKIAARMTSRGPPRVQRWCASGTAACTACTTPGCRRRTARTSWARAPTTARPAMPHKG